MLDVRSLFAPATHLDDPLVQRTRQRALRTSLVALAVTVCSYAFLVITAGGQRFENAALSGARQAREFTRAEAWSAHLDTIIFWTLIASMIVVPLIGLVRRRLDLAVVGGGLIAVALGIAELLKKTLPRPDLVGAPALANNTFPSGHIAIAMTVLFGLMIVVPYRLRGLALLLSTGYAVGLGAQNVTTRWHRLSDAIGADAVALAVACVLIAYLAGRYGMRSAGGQRRITPRVLILVAPLALYTAGSVITGAGLLLVGDAGTRDSAEWTAYLAAQAFSAGAGGVTACAALWLLRRVDLGRQGVEESVPAQPKPAVELPEQAVTPSVERTDTARPRP